MKLSHTHILVASTIAVAIVLTLSFRVRGSGCAQVAEDSDALDGAHGAGARLAAVDGAEESRTAQTESFVPGFFSAPIGSEFVYQFAGSSSAVVELAVEGRNAEESMTQSAAGVMQVAIAARRSGEHVAVISFPTTSVEVSAGGQTRHDTPLETALAQPCLVRFVDDGRLVGFRFDDAVPAAARNWIRNQVALFHFEIEPGTHTTWEREERDTSGTSRVRYVRAADTGAEDIELRKTRLTCVVAAGDAGGAPLEVDSEVTSDTTGALSKSLMCVRSAAYDERLVIPVASLGITTRVAQSGSLRLVQHGRCAPGTLPLVDWDERWDSVVGTEEAQNLAENGEKILRGRLLEGVTLAGLLSEIDALTRAEPRDVAALMDARHKLAELLADQPGLIASLAPLIPTMHLATADTVLGAAGAAGHAQAQGLLSDVLADAQLPTPLRQSSLDALFQLARPIDRSYDTVSRLVADASAPAGLRANGMLAFGALASMNGESDTARSARVAELVQLERQARADQRLEHWLRALGNTGSPEVFAAARPYLENADPLLRRAAADAVRGAHTPEAFEALSRHAQSDANAGVRRTCAAILADRKDASSLATVRKILEHETAVEVRRAAVDALARRVSTDANARNLLVHVANNDPSKELRAHAASAL